MPLLPRDESTRRSAHETRLPGFRGDSGVNTGGPTQFQLENLAGESRLQTEVPSTQRETTFHLGAAHLRWPGSHSA